METFKFYKHYKGFTIFKKDSKTVQELIGFKLTEDKKNYEFRTKNYKTLKSVETSIDKYLSSNKKNDKINLIKK